jgi:hypothetical protein
MLEQWKADLLLAVPKIYTDTKPNLLDLGGLIVRSTCDDRFWTGSGHAEL